MAQNQEETPLINAMDIVRDVILYPGEMTSILNQIGYQPQREDGSKKKIGYFMDVYTQEGIFGFSRGLISFIIIHCLYAYVWGTSTVKFTLAGIFGDEAVYNDYPSQLNLQFRLVRMAIRESAAVIATQPFHVLQTRQVAQFVGKETRYSALIFGLLQIYAQNGICGPFYGLLPRLLATTIVNGVIEIMDWLFQCYAVSIPNKTNKNTVDNFVMAHKEDSRNLNRRIGRIFGILLSGNMDKITTNMEADYSGLKADEIQDRARYKAWINCVVKIICRKPPLKNA